MRWVADPSTGGLQAVATDSTLTGTGVTSSLLGLADNAVTTTKILDGAVATDDVSDSAVTESKLSIHNAPQDGYYLEFSTSLGMQWVADPSTGGLSAVTSDSTLTGTGVSTSPLGLANDAVTTAKIATGAVTETDLGNNAVTLVKMADNSVGSAEIVTGAVGSTEIATGAVGTTELAANAVTSSEIAADAVGVSEIGTAAVGSDEIIDGSIGLTDLASGFVVGHSILGIDAVETDNIKDGAVNSAKIADGTITANDLASNSVTTAKVNADAITTDKIADGAVGLNDLASNAVDSSKIIAGGVNTSELADDSVTIAKMADNSVGSAEIANNAVGSSEIADGAVGTTELADSSVTGAKIAANSVGRADLVDNAVGPSKVADEAITEPKLKIGGTATNGYAILWDGASGGAMEWAQMVVESVEDEAITEPKLRISDVPSDGQVLTWDDTNDIMKWAVAGATSIANDSITTNKLEDGAVTEPKLADDAVSTRAIADNAVTSAQIGVDAVTGTELAGDSVTSSHIVDGAVAANDLADDAVTESKLALTTTATSSSKEGFQITWTSSGMDWIAAYENVIRLLTTLPSTAAQILAADEAELIGEIETTGDALNALYYKGESDADEIQIRMDDITDRSHFAIGRAIGYNSGSVQPSLYGKGGAIFPTDPPGLTLLIEVEVGGGDWHMQMQWGSPDTPSFGTTTGSVIYLAYREAGANISTEVRQKMTLEAGAGWTSHPSGGGYTTQKFTPHSTYIFSFYDAESGGTKYTIPDVIEDHLAKLVDERHLQDSDGKIIDRINDVYAKTAHGSYRGDFDATRAEGYGKGDVVTAKGSETGSAQTDANTVIYIARNNITKGTGDLDQPHEDDGNWLEISNGFEDVLLNEALVDASAIPAATWVEKGLDRAITADDNERNIVLEFEHTTSTTQINAPSIFTHVVMGPVDRWLSLTTKATSVQDFEESMCGIMPGPFGVNFSSNPTTNVVCIARNAGNYGMLIYVQVALPSVRTYITLK